MALENIARRQKYPCGNRHSGYRELLSTEQINEHNSVCVYGKLKCPFELNRNCSWNGFKSDLNLNLDGLVRFAERPNLASARVPSRFKRALQP